ncbi:type VII secretion protein EsaA [Shouchella lonarensis]|uniref:Type VII secretion protein EsaA, N-terminal domain-containing protein n=1 Tax=Shouchella lonarensis TaxID=1464122 RepID=A0A1G6GY22_9BACI|nr:type VII secretion protein EsaA [Shouchella lonarensis]SDB86889.1 type VII secretion protein EsaA, N-terminal domain-containing protein [Shouchella lonarensis]
MKNKKGLITLLIAIVVIAATPLVFFNYIGSEPMFQPKNTTDQIAIVNEDDGYQKALGDDIITLGQDLVQTIQDEESGYEWPVVSRLAAQSGIDNKEYDAVIFIPSSFSRDIMSFKEAIPSITNVRYEMSPHLNAKNQERVQKELEAAQQTLNGQVTAMYWRYVSEEVHGVQTNFDEVLDKEVNFLNEMHAFYAPSSKELGQEIDRQRERLGQLFSYSKDATGIAGNSHSTLSEGEKAFETLTKNIDTYLTYQQDLTTSLLATDQANEQLISDSSTTFQTLLQDGERRVREGQTPFQPQLENKGENVYAFLNQFHNGMGTLNQQMYGFDRNMNTSFHTLNNEIERLPNTYEQVIQSYNKGNNWGVFISTLKSTLAMRNEVLSQHTLPYDPGHLTMPLHPLEPLEPDMLKDVLEHVQYIRASLVELEPEKGDLNPDPTPDPDPDPTPDPPEESDDHNADKQETPEEASSKDDQENVPSHTDNSAYDTWKLTIERTDQLKKELEEDVQKDINDNRELVSQYMGYLEDLHKLVESLQGKTKELPETFLKKVQQREERILSSPPASDFQFSFVDPIENRDPNVLMDYYNLLGQLELASQLHRASGTVDQDIRDKALKDFARTAQLKAGLQDSENNVKSFMSLTEDINNFQTFSVDARGEMDTLLQDTNTILTNLSAEIKEEQQLVLSLANETRESANNTLEQMRSSRQPIEIEPGPVEGLDGSLVQISHQTSLSEIEQLGQSVSSLSEHQDNLIGSTEDMFTQVATVQNKSDDLNDRWKNSVGTTQLVHDDMNNILQNAINDGYFNDNVYNYLSNPVNVAGEQVEGPAESFTPPVVMLVIILLVSLMIGYLAHHYRELPIPVHLSLYGILSIALGLIISIYGLNIYKMTDAQAIQWTIITVLLILATAGVIRLLLMIGPWMGTLGSVLIIFLFTIPLLDMAMPNFHSDNPIAALFMSIQHKEQQLFFPGAMILAAITCLSIAIPVAKHIREKHKLRNEAEDEEYEV